MTSETLGGRIRAARVGLGLTQEEVAAAAGVSRGLVAKLERNAHTRLPAWSELRRIERVLEFPHGGLMATAGYDGEPIPPKPRDLEGVLREALAIVQDLKRRGITLGEDGPADSTSQNFSFEKRDNKFDPTFVYT